MRQTAGIYATARATRRKAARSPRQRVRTLSLAALVLAAVLAGCASPPAQQEEATLTRDQARAIVLKVLPPGTADRAGWATDIHAALATQQLPVTKDSVCAVLAIIGQESSYRADPTVPRMSEIAWNEIHRRAERVGVPRLVVDTALRLSSSDGRSYAERIDAARSERDLSDTFDDFIGMVPMGARLFGSYNPVRTGGPMQVSIAFAEDQARKGYPYPIGTSIRKEVFTRRGGIWFGTAHLLDYPAPYDRMIFRFADFNAGRYASRNAAFQNALTATTGVPLTLDGDLVRRDGEEAPGATELAARAAGRRLDLSNAAVRRDLERQDDAAFADTALARGVYRLADQGQAAPLPRAVLPQIALTGPKISRPLTTEWFARRVDERFQRCLKTADTASIDTTSRSPDPR